MSMKFKHQRSIRKGGRGKELRTGLESSCMGSSRELELDKNWIGTGELRKETEGLIFAAQDEALRKKRRKSHNRKPKCIIQMQNVW